jgi:hypothetical protein
MRLLEFSKDRGGANPQQSRARRAKSQSHAPLTPTKPAARPDPARTPPDDSKIREETYPMRGSAVRKLVRRGPIDLEQLQQRIGFVERRLQEESVKTEQLATRTDVEQLRERMNRIEHTLEQELTTAHTREERLLQALDRPPLKILVKTRAIQFWQEDLHRIAAWLLKTARRGWQEFQPEWWPQLASAWKEALEKARQ